MADAERCRLVGRQQDGIYRHRHTEQCASGSRGRYRGRQHSGTEKSNHHYTAARNAQCQAVCFPNCLAADRVASSPPENKLLRWKTKSTKLSGGTPEPSVSHGRKGLAVKKLFPTSGRGEVFLLTFPFIELVFTLTTLRRPINCAKGQRWPVMGMYRQLHHGPLRSSN